MPEMTSYERDFELRFLKGRGTAFQDFFSELMECAHPSDFQRIRPHGNWGDLKCDGYLRSGRTVFQVYAPETMRNVKRLLMKVSADFEGARAHWGDRMNRWVFVHNMRDGLPAPAVQFLQDLGEQLNAPDVDVWGYIELWRLFERLNPDDRRALFPPIAYHVSAPPSPCLPKPSETEAYWAWLASAPLEQPINGPLVALRNLNLPIRIVTPEDVRAQRSRDAHAIERYARNTTSWRIAPDDGSFVEHRESQYSRETWDISRVLRHNRHVLIVGDAGSGKSTLLHRFAVQEGRRLAALTWERACRRRTLALLA